MVDLPANHAIDYQAGPSKARFLGLAPSWRRKIVPTGVEQRMFLFNPMFPMKSLIPCLKRWNEAIYLWNLHGEQSMKNHRVMDWITDFFFGQAQVTLLTAVIRIHCRYGRHLYAHTIPLWIEWKCWCEQLYSDKSSDKPGDVDHLFENAPVESETPGYFQVDNLYRIAVTEVGHEHHSP